MNENAQSLNDERAKEKNNKTGKYIWVTQWFSLINWHNFKMAIRWFLFQFREVKKNWKKHEKFQNNRSTQEKSRLFVTKNKCG